MRIGELAKKGRTSIKALHLYHELGLLEPNTVDESGHRIYSEHSLLVLQRLQSLKKLGFTLLEIQGLLKMIVPEACESGPQLRTLNFSLEELGIKCNRSFSIKNKVAVVRW